MSLLYNINQNIEHVWGFYYGGLINSKVMQNFGMIPKKQEIACLQGYDLEISPLMNLVQKQDKAAYGLLLLLPHQQIEHAYSQLKAKYFSYPVLAQNTEGCLRPALCYLLLQQKLGEVDKQYVNNLLEPAILFGFPGHYIDHIRSFLPD